MTAAPLLNLCQFLLINVKRQPFSKGATLLLDGGVASKIGGQAFPTRIGNQRSNDRSGHTETLMRQDLDNRVVTRAENVNVV